MEYERIIVPLASKYPSWSPYNYTLNNPINMIDPDGRSVENDFSTTGEYLGSDNKGDEIRIIDNYDSNKSLLSQSSLYSENYLTPGAHTNILSFYADVNGFCDVECAAMPNGLSNEMEVR